MSYKQTWERLKNLISEPLPEAIEGSFTPMVDAFRQTKMGLKSEVESVPFGSWDFINKHFGGLRMREFSIICGPTGVGKTTMLANIAVQLQMQLTPIFVASVENGTYSFIEKMISIYTGKDLSQSRPMTDEQVLELEKTCGKWFKTKQSLFANYDSRVPHMRLLCDLLHAHENYGTKVAILDNLNFFMEVTDSKNQLSQMDKTVHDFVVFSKKVPMHIFLVMHPKKTDNGRVESEFDIKGSSTSVQEASNVFLFNRLKNESDAPMGSEHLYCRELKIAKARQRGKSVNMRFVFSVDKFSEAYSCKRVL